MEANNAVVLDRHAMIKPAVKFTTGIVAPKEKDPSQVAQP